MSVIISNGETENGPVEPDAPSDVSKKSL